MLYLLSIFSINQKDNFDKFVLSPIFEKLKKKPTSLELGYSKFRDSIIEFFMDLGNKINEHISENCTKHEFELFFKKYFKDSDFPIKFGKMIKRAITKNSYYATNYIALLNSEKVIDGLVFDPNDQSKHFNIYLSLKNSRGPTFSSILDWIKELYL